MKKALFLTLSIILSLSVATAAPLRKPSPAQIKKLIMSNPRIDLEYVGLNDTDDCKSVTINNLKILKIGRVGSIYYNGDGSIGSSFRVKFKMKGSCLLKKPVNISYVYDKKLRRTPEFRNRTLEGSLPIRPKTFFVDISTDVYGDWGTSVLYPEGGYNPEYASFAESTKAYIRNLYSIRNNKAKTVDEYKKFAKEQLSSEAQAGWNTMQYDKAYELNAGPLLDSQPQHIREEIGRTYWKISNSSKKSQFLRKVITFLRSQETKSNRSKHSGSRPMRSRPTRTSNNNSHSHGGRIHSHKLPRQGKAHRHGNGALGH